MRVVIRGDGNGVKASGWHFPFVPLGQWEVNKEAEVTLRSMAEYPILAVNEGIETR
jgi:hypothetical protein